MNKLPYPEHLGPLDEHHSGDWLAFAVGDDIVHVYPESDLIVHEAGGPRDGDVLLCPCGPTPSAVPKSGGTLGWVLTHHSLDGRELAE